MGRRTGQHVLLLTNLINRTQPLIRYEITDLVTLVPGPDPTGLQFRRITEVTGRSDDILHLPARAGGTIAVPPYRLRASVVTDPHLRQYQIVHTPTGLRIAVVLRHGAPSDSPQRIQAAVRRGLLDAGAAPPPITVTPVDRIDREPGHAAKFKTVKAMKLDPTGPASGLAGVTFSD